MQANDEQALADQDAAIPPQQANPGVQQPAAPAHHPLQPVQLREVEDLGSNLPPLPHDCRLATSHSPGTGLAYGGTSAGGAQLAPAGPTMVHTSWPAAPAPLAHHPRLVTTSMPSQEQGGTPTTRSAGQCNAWQASPGSTGATAVLRSTASTGHVATELLNSSPATPTTAWHQALQPPVPDVHAAQGPSSPPLPATAHVGPAAAGPAGAQLPIMSGAAAATSDCLLSMDTDMGGAHDMDAAGGQPWAAPAAAAPAAAAAFMPARVDMSLEDYIQFLVATRGAAGMDELVMDVLARLQPHVSPEQLVEMIPAVAALLEAALLAQQ